MVLSLGIFDFTQSLREVFWHFPTGLNKCPMNWEIVLRDIRQFSTYWDVSGNITIPQTLQVLGSHIIKENMNTCNFDFTFYGVLNLQHNNQA